MDKENKKKNNGYIEYHGEMYGIRGIAKIEHLSEISLMKYYEESDHDIYEAVAKAKAAQDKYHGDILYKGRLMNLSSISKEEDINITSLSNYYLQPSISLAFFMRSAVGDSTPSRRYGIPSSAYFGTPRE